MKAIISTAFILILISCQNQNSQTNESSDSTTASVEPTIEMLKENTMMLYRQDPDFLYYEKNASELENENIFGLYEVYQVCEELAKRIKNSKEVEAAKSELIEIVDEELAGIIAMGQKNQKENIYLTYQSISSKLKEINFSPENMEQSLLNIAIVENMLVKNMIHDKNHVPFKFNKFEAIAFANDNTIRLNDSIPINVFPIAYDSTEALHVKYADNPEDLDNNNTTEFRGGQLYIKGKKKGNHTLYGLLKLTTIQGEERWLNWEYSYTVK